MGEAIKTKCKSCGSNLEYDPNSGNLKCAMCGVYYPFNRSTDYPTRKVELGNLEVSDKKDASNVTIRSCKCCGARFTGKLMSLTNKCEYCGATMMVEDLGCMPDACVPFAFDRKEALAKFTDDVKNRRFVNKSFKKRLVPDKIESLYIPSYAFSSDVEANYRGNLYKEHKDREGNTHIRRFNISGTEYGTYDNILIECSEHITQSELTSIEPFNISNANKFVPEFIYGYSVEYYNRTVEEAGKFVRETIEQRVRRKILNRYDYDGINSFHVDYNYRSSKYSYMLVPVYKLHFKFKKKTYCPLVNGQTGKVGGKLPSNVGKIVWTVILSLLGIGVIIGLIYMMSTGDVPLLEEILDGLRG